MRLRQNRFKIKIPVYDSEINVIVTEDIAESYNKLCKRLEWLDLLESSEDSVAGSAYFIYDDNQVGDYYMLLPYDADVFLISHEVLHATFIILGHHDVIFDKNNHEAFTYLHGHLVEMVYDKLKSFK